MAAARRWADRVCRQPPLPVEMGKASINAMVRALDRAVYHLDDYALALTADSTDSARAKEAFFRGGQPEWEYK